VVGSTAVQLAQLVVVRFAVELHFTKFAQDWVAVPLGLVLY